MREEVFDAPLAVHVVDEEKDGMDPRQESNAPQMDRTFPEVGTHVDRDGSSLLRI